MRMRLLIPLASSLALAACTSHHAAEAQPSADHEPVVSEAHERPTELHGSVWRWTHFGSDNDPFSDHGPSQIQASRWWCAVEQAELCCQDGKQRWCAELREQSKPKASLVADDSRIFVAEYPQFSSGARFAAFELNTGKQLWAREAVALGPQEHSEYLNVVQLRLADRRLIAYGEEAHGAYVEVMDPASGRLIENVRVGPPRSEWRWDHALAEPEPTVSVTLFEGQRCTASVGEDGRVTLGCPGWTHELEADLHGRAALASGRRLVLVTWSRIAGGARARAFDPADGTLVWDRLVEGLGVRAHSQYSNLVRIELDGDALVVRGREARGNYEDVYGLADGRLRWSIRWLPD